jgi:hypothetical protein
MPSKDIPKRRANYGAREEPRACPRCSWENSRVYGTQHCKDGTTIRYRICLHCRKQYPTTEPPANHPKPDLAA